MTSEKISIASFIDRYRDAGIRQLVARISFEQRSLSIAEALATRGDVTVTAFLSQERGSTAQQNYERLQRMLRGREVQSVELDLNDPLRVGANLANSIRKIHRETGLHDSVIDVTSFRREELLMLLSILGDLDIPKTSNCILAYVGAKSMGPWMSGQVTGHRSVLGYAGDMRPSLPTKLVVLMGFETQRAVSIIENYEPNKLVIGHGRRADSINSDLSKENDRLFASLASLYDDADTKFEFSARDPVAVADELEMALQPLEGHNVIIAPLHTKLSTLGAGVFARRHRSVQICYAPVAEYNEQAYSEPSEDVFVIPLAQLLTP